MRTLVVCAMISLQSTVAFSQQNQSICIPLVVLFGGAFDNKSEIVETLAKDLGGSFVDVEYYEHDEGNPARAYIKNHLKLYPNSPVVLIGHSWGGDTAYGLTNDWDIPVQLLGTLDAVGGRAYPGMNFTEFKKHLAKPVNAVTWRNVWIKPPGALSCILALGYFWNWNNCVADTGAPWGYQEFASNERFLGDHGDSYGMFGVILKDVVTSLRCP